MVACDFKLFAVKLFEKRKCSVKRREGAKQLSFYTVTRLRIIGKALVYYYYLLLVIGQSIVPTI